MKQCVETDIVIVGGGIAGLWTLNRLRQLGYSVILLESNVLGGEQTNKAQGIIHGGMKYALQGMLTNEATAIAKMPAIWNACLQGQGDLDLSHVTVLAKEQHLWSTQTLASKLAGFFASITLSGAMNSLKKEDYPAIFQHPDFQGQVYALQETVIDAHALIRELMKPHQDVIFKIDPLETQQLTLQNDELQTLQISAGSIAPLQVKAQKYIFTAGSGNEFIVNQLGMKTLRMQKRPLHMVMMKQDHLPPLYGHCLGSSSTPRITITTHKAHDGQGVWYIGGQIAETGVTRNSEEQIEFAKQELRELFPWQNFSKATFGSFRVNRAENLEPNGQKPSSCFAKEIGNMMIAWPTKLALAPLLSDEIIAKLKASNITPAMADLRKLRAWPMPGIAVPVWDEML